MSITIRCKKCGNMGTYEFAHNFMKAITKHVKETEHHDYTIDGLNMELSVG